MKDSITIQDGDGLTVFIYKEVAEAFGLRNGQRVDEAAMRRAITANAHLGIAKCEAEMEKIKTKKEAE